MKFSQLTQKCPLKLFFLLIQDLTKVYALLSVVLALRLLLNLEHSHHFPWFSMTFNHVKTSGQLSWKNVPHAELVWLFPQDFQVKYFQEEHHVRMLYTGTSLVAQWLRVHLPMQGTRVRSLVREDPTCCVAARPMRHNYWACALEPSSHNYWACMP